MRFGKVRVERAVAKVYMTKALESTPVLARPITSWIKRALVREEEGAMIPKTFTNPSFSSLSFNSFSSSDSNGPGGI